MSPEVYARSLCLAGQGAIAVVSARFFCYRNKILTVRARSTWSYAAHHVV